MAWLSRWLSREPTGGFRCLGWVICSTAILWIYAILVVNLYIAAGILLNSPTEAIKVPLTFPIFFHYLNLFALSAVAEEALFRAPVIIVFAINIVRGFSKESAFRVTAWAIIISSLIFGIVHGKNYAPFTPEGLNHFLNLARPVFHQGVMGVFFCLLFFKFGVWRGTFWKPFVMVSAIHFLYNFSLVVLIKHWI